MQGLLHANLSSLALSRSLTGGSFSFPKLQAGSDLVLKLRLTEDAAGTPVLSGRTVYSVSASIGKVDARPTAGTYQLTVDLSGTSVETGDISYGATAAQIQTALNAAMDGEAGLNAINPCVVSDPSGTGDFRIIFEDNTLTPDVTCTDNALWPVSFVTVESTEFDAGWVYHLRLVQTPVASVSTYDEIVPASPSVSELQAGATVDEVETNAIQKLTIPAEFAGGSFQLKRSGILTDPISLPTSAEEIAEQLVPLADDGGEFVVSTGTDAVFIEFAGDMGGVAQDLLEVVVFDAPPTDLLIKLDTNTREMRTAMQGADSTTGELTLPMEIEIELEDEQVEDTYQLVVFRVDLIFRGMIREEAYNASADLAWAQPRARTDYATHSPNALLVGHRSYQTQIGNGSATSFAIAHNLGPTSTNFTAVAATDVITATSHGLYNGDKVALTTSGTLPAGLSTGTDYWVISRTDDTLKLSATAGGSAVDITDTGSGTHTITRNDGAASGVHVTVINQTTSQRTPDNGYTLTIDSENQFTLSGFASTPTSNQYLVLVTTIGQPATYEAHTHTIAEVTDLQDTLDALSARIAALEALAPTGSSTTRLATTAVKIAQWPFRSDYFEVYPTRATVERPSEGSLSELLGQSFRGGGFLPAVHDSSAANLSTILTAGALPAASGYSGAVFLNNANGEITLTGGLGRRSAYLQNSEYVASDGTRWYRVTPYAYTAAGTTVTANASTDLLTATDHGLAVGSRVQFTTTGTLPAGLSTSTDYYVIDRTGDTFQVSATLGGSTVNITDTGSGTHTVTQQNETSYYPTDFERELFAFSVNSRQLILKSTLELNVGLELMTIRPDRRARERESRVQWSFVIEIGRFPQTTSPATTGLNLSAVTWDRNPVLEQRIIVTPDPTVHTFGLEVLRELVSDVDTLSANALYYGNAETTWAPYELPFAVRGRLVRFDTEDSVSDPRGLVAISGLARKPDSADAVTVDPLGLARVV